MLSSKVLSWYVFQLLNLSLRPLVAYFGNRLRSSDQCLELNAWTLLLDLCGDGFLLQSMSRCTWGIKQCYTWDGLATELEFASSVLTLSVPLTPLPKLLMDLWVAWKKCMSSCTPMGVLNLQRPNIALCKLQKAWCELRCTDVSNCCKYILSRVPPAAGSENALRRQGRRDFAPHLVSEADTQEWYMLYATWAIRWIDRDSVHNPKTVSLNIAQNMTGQTCSADC